jgi:hypothetical protein
MILVIRAIRFGVLNVLSPQLYVAKFSAMAL